MGKVIWTISSDVWIKVSICLIKKFYGLYLTSINTVQNLMSGYLYHSLEKQQ